MNRRAGLRALMSSAAMGACGLLGAAPDVWAQADRSSSSGRIVSVHGSLTEVFYLLGAQSQLVGTDTTSSYPEAAMHTTKVGYLRQLSAEGLLALRPHAVLGTDEAGPPIVLSQLAQAGVPLHLVKVSHSFQEVLDKVRLVGTITLRQKEAKALSDELQTQWIAVRSRMKRSTQTAAPRVLFIMAHGGAPMAAGSGTAAQAIIDLVGASNVLAGVRGYRPMNAESVAQARPDWVLTTHESVAASGGVAGLWQQPGLSLTPAGRRQRLISLDAMALLGFGPRLPATLGELQHQLA